MPPVAAKAVCVIWVAALFYLNRDKSVRTSIALWIPVLWLAITGSRPISEWLGVGGSTAFQGPTVAGLDNGSPVDALFYGSLTAIGLAILAGRWQRTRSILAMNWPVLLYFGYCFVSVAWSDTPEIAFKRWIKATGDVVIALLVATDLQPLAALRRLFSRLAFLLLPFSLISIRYLPQIGRYFEMDGSPGNGGVTFDKNALGTDAFILGIGALWQILRLLPRSDIPKRSRQLLAQGCLVIVAAYLAVIAHSTTAATCFTLGATLMLLLHTRKYKGRPKAVKSLIATLGVIVLLIQITGAQSFVFEMMGKNRNLTGRADQIWPKLIPLCPNVLIGAGFESFWTGARMQKLWNYLQGQHLNQSHNGYLEVYLQLGMIGLLLIILMFFYAFRTAIAALRNNPNGASVMVVYVSVILLYNYTEAGFRMLRFTWSFLLLLIIMASFILKHAKEAWIEETPEAGAVDGECLAPRTIEWTPQQQIGVSGGFWGSAFASQLSKGEIS
jgi:exopolysaccharide production protein ExoQ